MPESHELLPVPHSLLSEPSGVAGLTQLCSRTVARSPTHHSLPYDHLPAAVNSRRGRPPRRYPRCGRTKYMSSVDAVLKIRSCYDRTQSSCFTNVPITSVANEPTITNTVNDSFSYASCRRSPVSTVKSRSARRAQ
jgi:hypothetical protein